MVEDNNPQDQLAAEAAALDGYFSDTPLEPEPNYPPLDEQFNRCVVISSKPYWRSWSLSLSPRGAHEWTISNA